MKSFQKVQMDFIAHVKNPEANPYQGQIEDRRLGIYRELFFNNVSGFISSGFPVLESLYSKQDWQVLVRKFFAEHACSSPFFIDISKEFVEYLAAEYVPTESDPAFMQELAHYEWLELDVSVRQATEQILPWDGDKTVSHVAMSELASLVGYHYPVHQISVDFQPTESQGMLYLVVYRDNEDEVNFTLVNEVTAHLLSLIQGSGTSVIKDLIDDMSQAMPQIEPQQVGESLQQVIKQLLNQQVLLPVYAQ